jgi:soluble P-type ATPase
MVNAAFATGLRTPLDQAILDGGPDPAAGGWRRLAELPFDFERRRVSVLAERAGRRLLVVKGAAEGVLERCSRIEGADGTVAALDAAGRAALLAGHDARAADGLRQLAVAWAPAGAGRSDCAPTDERDLVFAGFCVFADPAKASAAGAVARLEAAGVRVKILSGDAAPAVQHLVRTLGIPARGLLTGAEVDGLADAALAVRVTEVDVYARLSPDQKVRVIRALRAAGATVGFIGDGINDAPAIRLADAGISVEGASDVARGGTDIILTPTCRWSPTGWRRGDLPTSRSTCAWTSSNFGNMISVAVASLFLPFLPRAGPVLLNNLIYDLARSASPSTARPTTSPTRTLEPARRAAFLDGRRAAVVRLRPPTFAVLFFVFALGRLFRTPVRQSMATRSRRLPHPHGRPGLAQPAASGPGRDLDGGAGGRPAAGAVAGGCGLRLRAAAGAASPDRGGDRRPLPRGGRGPEAVRDARGRSRGPPGTGRRTRPLLGCPARRTAMPGITIDTAAAERIARLLIQRRQTLAVSVSAGGLIQPPCCRCRARPPISGRRDHHTGTAREACSAWRRRTWAASGRPRSR